MRGLLLIALSSALGIDQARAQEVSVPSVTTASPGGYANPLKLDTDRYKRQSNMRTSVRNQPTRCSADAMPASDKRRIQAEYNRITRTQGRPAAENWARQEGMRFRQQLVSQGICPPVGSATGTTAGRPASERRTVRNANGAKCTKTTMQARNIANPGGGAMSMIMVPVCVN